MSSPPHLARREEGPPLDRQPAADDVEQPINTAIIAVAKKVVRELGADPHATVTLREFEALAAAEVAEIQESVVCLSPKDMLGGGAEGDDGNVGGVSNPL